MASDLGIRLVTGALGGCGAAVFCHPLDVFRVQMQTPGKYKNLADCAVKIFQQGGIRAYYNGLTAAFLRQWTYGSCRVGIYAFLLNKLQPKGSPPLSVFQKLGLGGLSGGIGAFVGTPSEVALVRMADDLKKPIEDRRGYKNVVDCLVRMWREEGPKSIFKGADVTVARAVALASCTMGITSEAKQQMAKMGIFKNPDGVLSMLVSTTVASFFANIASLPFDVVKSRWQTDNAKGEHKKYTSVVHCFKKSVAEEGVLVLWRGFTPALVKLAPYTVISLYFANHLTMWITGTSAV